MTRNSLFVFIVIVFSHKFSCSQGKHYSDGRGGKIFLPLGKLSFADEVVLFTKGNPKAIEEASDSSDVLGEANYNGYTEKFTSLGCGGSIIVKFIDNVLIDIDGDDLFVYEVGKFVEKTSVEISKDLKSWIKVGEISGGISSVDIGKFIKKDEVYRYVKLTDLKVDCTGKWPGADIDAIAAIGAGKEVNINSSVLYRKNEFELLNDAKKELDKVIEQINSLKPSKVIIEGHTDNTGTDEHNQVLSQKRAESVFKYINSKCPNYESKIKRYGYGSSLPIDNSNTKEGQEKNRRVSIILVP